MNAKDTIFGANASAYAPRRSARFARVPARPAERIRAGSQGPLHFQQISNNFTPRSVVDYAPSHPATEQPAPRHPEKSFKTREHFALKMRL